MVVGEQVGRAGETEAGVEGWLELTDSAECDVETKEVDAKVEKVRGLIDFRALAQEHRSDEMSKAVEQDLKAAYHQQELLKKVDDLELEQIERTAFLQEIVQERENCAQELKERMQSWGYRIRNSLHLKDKKAVDLETKNAQLTAEWDELNSKNLDEQIIMMREEAEKIKLDAAQAEVAEHENLPLSPEEKKEVLDFKVLEKLTTDEYFELWKRLNPHFVTHVTRQGIRDHKTNMNHTAWFGEFCHGFTDVMENQKQLGSMAAVNYGMRGEVDDLVVQKAVTEEILDNPEYDLEEVRKIVLDPDRRGCFDFSVSKNVDENVVKYLVHQLSLNNQGIAYADPWADKTAVHFAQHEVLDDIYGGESDNEIFFVFPSDVIASQCLFGSELDKAQDGISNDVFVWAKEGEIPIDAGVTFVPKSTMVDVETGSKYVTKIEMRDGKEVKVPEIDSEKVATVKEWIEGLTAEDVTHGKLREKAKSAGISEEIANDMFGKGRLYDFKQIVEDGIGHHPLGCYWAYDMMYATDDGQERLEAISRGEKIERTVDEWAYQIKGLWKLSTNTISAEKYWEKYFSDHPDQKPAHIIYYDGDSSAAINNELQRRGILEVSTDGYWLTGKNDVLKRDGQFLGFDGNFSSQDDERVQAGHDEFNRKAEEIIKDYYNLQY